MDSGHNKDTIQGVHNVSGVTVTSYNPPTRHRWLHSSHTSDERWPSKVMSWPRKEFQWTTIVWRSDASLGQRQPTTFVCSVHCWGVLSLVCSCSFCLLSLMRRYWAVFVLHTPALHTHAQVSTCPDSRTQTLDKLCDMFHSINCESQFEFSFQSDNWILQHIQSIVLLSISGRVFVVVHSSSSVYTMQDWESNHLWFPRAKKPNIWVGVSLAAAAYLPCCSDTMGTNSIDFCIINIQRGRNQQAVVFIICSTISRSRQPWQLYTDRGNSSAQCIGVYSLQVHRRSCVYTGNIKIEFTKKKYDFIHHAQIQATKMVYYFGCSMHSCCDFTKFYQMNIDCITFCQMSANKEKMQEDRPC